MNQPWREMIEPCWRRLIETYADARVIGGFYESRPRRRGDPKWAYNWGFGALLACAGAICAQGASAVLTASDWQRLEAGLLGYAKEGHGFSSTTRLTRRPAGDTFYDDNAWVALAALDLEEQPYFHGIAEELYRFLLQGWDAASGGVWWKEAPRATLHVCSTGPVAVLASRLYRRRPDVVDLTPIWRMMSWLETMRTPDGRYWDNQRAADGRINHVLYTYNTGTPLQAMALLEGVQGCRFEAQVRTSLQGASLFLDGAGRLPDTPWFNAVLLRGILAVHQQYGLTSSLWPVYAAAMDQALSEFRRSGLPLSLPSRDNRQGVLLRDAAASVEILALLSR